MHKCIVVSFLLCALLIPVAAPLQADDFAQSTLGKEVIDLGLKFLDNPGDFFFNLHSDNEDFSPLPAARNGSLRFNYSNLPIVPIIPTTWLNLNVKVKLFNDRGYYPQVDMVGMYGDLLALRIAGASMEDAKPSFTDYAVGTVISKAASGKTRIFGGIKYASVDMEVAFSSPVALGAFSMSRVSFKVADTSFFTGISHETGPDKLVVAQVGYGFKYKKITSRVMVSRKHLELGLDFYPEGLFVIHPFMSWHWYF